MPLPVVKIEVLETMLHDMGDFEDEKAREIHLKDHARSTPRKPSCGKVCEKFQRCLLWKRSGYDLGYLGDVLGVQTVEKPTGG